MQFLIIPDIDAISLHLLEHVNLINIASFWDFYPKNKFLVKCQQHYCLC